MKYILTLALSTLSIQAYCLPLLSLYSSRHIEASRLKLMPILFKEIKATSNIIDKCELLNKLSYIEFLQGTSLTATLNPKSDEYKKRVQEEKIYLESSSSNNQTCLDLLEVRSYNVKDYKSYSTEEKKALALNLQTQLSTKARLAEIQGNAIGDKLAALKLWNKHIKPGMKLIIQLRHGNIFYSSPYRVLGIALTEMPKIAGGDKDLAMTYLRKAIKDTTWPGRNISKYIYNSIALANLYHKKKENNKACAILNEIKNISSEETKIENEELLPEFIIDKQIAIKKIDNFNC